MAGFPSCLACALFALLALFALGAPRAHAAQEVAERALDPTSGHTYLRTEEPLVFLEAEAVARALGGALVSITSSAEEIFLLENFGAEPYWIGLEFPHETWASGEAVGFTHWSLGEPTGTTDEPYVLMNWGEPGTWGDTHGDVESVRYRALIEFPKGVEPGPIPDVPVTQRAKRGVLLVAIQDLLAKDLESPKNPNLFQLWKASAWTHEASGDGSGDPLAGLGMLLWGTGSAKSRLTSANPPAAARDKNQDLLARLERTQAGITTAALFDDPALAGILLGGRVDLRVSSASPRKGGSAAPLADALARTLPACIVSTWTNLDTPGRAAPNELARAKEIAAVDRELGVLLAALRARPAYAAEEWLVVVCALAPAALKNPAKKARDELLPESIPLLFVGSTLPAGEILGQIGLVDVPAAALVHLGIEPRRSWGLDGVVPGRTAVLGENLLVNAGAEDQFGGSRGAHALIAGWRTLGGFRIARHDAETGGPPARGQSYLQGGDDVTAAIDQRIDLGALAADIERGSLRFRLSGWLGARKDSGVTLECSLEFLSAQKKTLETIALGKIEPGGKNAPAGALGEFSATGRVPRRARAARLVLAASGAKGSQGAMADEFVLVLERD